MLILTIQHYYPDQPQTPIEDGGLTSAHVSKLQFRPEKPLHLIPGRHVVITRSECSRVTWHKVIAHPPPSHARVAQALAVASELQQMPRDQLVALARTAKGSMRTAGENAAAIVRRLRDEWDDND